MWRGMDVSEFQGRIDWDRVTTDFVILRAGFGQNTLDAEFIRNITECGRRGIPCGVYWYSYALDENGAAAEARRCLEAVKPYRLEYPICFDYEYDSVRYARDNGVNVTRRLATDMVKAFCSTIEEAGYYTMYYSNEDYLRNMFYPEELKRYDLWYALYSGGSEPGRADVGIWQYTGSGSAVGISGSVDLDYGYKDYAKVIREAGLNHLENSGSDRILEFQKLTYPRPDGTWNEITALMAGQNTLYAGSGGELTVLAQRCLIDAGYRLEYGADGIYGEETMDQVRKFQQDRGLYVDGIVGEITWKALLS